MRRGTEEEDPCGVEPWRGERILLPDQDLPIIYEENSLVENYGLDNETCIRGQ